MGEITKEEIRERLGNIDQIRDIIFGAHLREYNSRLEKMESDLQQMQQETRDRLNEVRDLLSAELKVVVEALDKRLKTISNNSQEETADLRQQVDRLNRKFTNNIETLDQELDAHKNAIREELTQTREDLQDDTRELKSLVFEELEQRFSMLREVKVSKDDMAELLFELGMRLKGTEFVPELREAVEGEIDEKYPELSLLDSVTSTDTKRASTPRIPRTPRPSTPGNK
ncbi:MAG: apolipoprotein A1/A4/E family protein [Oscillatoriales cyanobacterium SM2_2_1]|nr:apolipoprotein A1/A4/E family protein [Oscillatoriales cyanobacterium SM2_2_1]